MALLFFFLFFFVFFFFCIQNWLIDVEVEKVDRKIQMHVHN